MGYVGRKPADAALTSADIAPGSVDTAQLAADAVTTAKIAPATVASSCSCRYCTWNCNNNTNSSCNNCS